MYGGKSQAKLLYCYSNLKTYASINKFRLKFEINIKFILLLLYAFIVSRLKIMKASERYQSLLKWRTTMDKECFPLSRVYGLLEPGPVVLITTAHQGRHNIMTQSWHTMMEFEPPLVGCVISDRNYSFSLLRASKECVMNIPTVELAEKVVACGNMSGAKIDKFEKLCLTPNPAATISTPLIAECFANLECKVVDTRLVNRYCFFIVEVISAWIDPAVKNPRTIHHLGRGKFMIAGDHIRLKSKMK